MKEKKAKLYGMKKSLETCIGNTKERIVKDTKKLTDDEMSLSSINYELEKINQGKIIVSDHALVRLFERKYKYPVDKIREDLVRLVSENLPSTSRETRYVKIEDHLTAVVKDGAVVTIQER